MYGNADKSGQDLSAFNFHTLGTFIPGGLGASLEVCRDKIFAGKIVNMAVLREVS